ncbi:MAG: hypothetical protein EON58_11080 [Alphaproteobacteria bacterium]|nr:MAG: hypothetical protein EON58_11080 [Alphaproteobacteria bacterium]
MSGPARNRKLLKRRIDDFLWRDRSMPVSRLRDLLAGPFSSLGRVAIVGGFVRDFARDGRRAFRSDIDLVIEAPRHEVDALALELAAIPNRFGGYAFHHPHWKVDFWSLETTWAVVNGHATADRLEDIVNVTFFDCDAILYDLGNKRIVADDAYFSRLAMNQIDINLRPNPSEEGNLLRAIRRVFCWGAEPGPALRTFIVQNLDDDCLNRINIIEKSLYPIAVTDFFLNAAALKCGITDPVIRTNLETSLARQLSLPGF